MEKTEERKNAIKDLAEYTDAEKIEKFDALYKYAESMLSNIENNVDYCEDNDDSQYSWEAIMELLATDNKLFWKYYNSLY